MNYLLDCWYCAAWSSEVSDAPIGRTLLETPIVLYRDSADKLIALDGACPHRFAPLAEGQVTGDEIMCPYHGLRFDRTGACTHNPHGSGAIPPNARVKSYPIVERNGVIWIWLGNPDAADETQLSNRDWLVSGDYACAKGHLLVHANYQMVIDNLLDLTHAPYLHAGTVGGNPEDSIGAIMDHKFHMGDGNVIHSDYFVAGMPRPTPQMLPLWGDRPGDFRAEMTWRPAATLELDIRMSPPNGNKNDGLHLPSLHYLVPESETKTHYFFAIGRNVMIDDEEQTVFMGEMARRAFEEEDEPMIRQCAELMGTTDLFSLKPTILETDIAGVQARRVLAKLIRQEAAAAA
ncbi:Rieske 2Fe-2S domain-containing protein [Altererythrobacter sp.]|uniref:Rieske 2Fe-2S domain-containing protein n=1 Tax=Altererythrobacter sp. TaxID=1872480 RepID=UPI003D03D3E6